MTISPNDAGNVLRSYVRESPGATGPAPGAARADAAVSEPSVPPDVGSGVTFSSQAADMAKWLAQLRSLPAVRSEQVAGVAQQIQNGQYPPPASDVADKILTGWLVSR